ncbi:prepilin-type cleavage/methylation domain-containing protein [Acinetobacter sp. ANC 3903]|uniref:PilW family protein n=1 Tax=Acinetobacter sp. ANC 3903 TaxID=1977883 RepID=UPI000A34E767|nr:PilW family protein [Acinetobacter sp. ANC 3903]OTG63719.1 prepilin-type cleavage/methylation domain-containing protein [Acinetobacter sp. ANC 3903]
MVHKHYTSGFTLIELMVALTLGLLIVAAGLAVFLSSSRSLGLQSGMSELQQNANFGLSLVAHDLRHTNLNTVSSQRVNNITTGSGIVFKKENLPAALQTITDLETELVSLQNKDTDNTTGKSDRLTIQYVPAINSIVNCEGETISAASSKTIVQRYYVAESPQQVTGEPTAYSLYCDAGYYAAGDTTIAGLNTRAQQMMQRVDAFKIRLGVKNSSGQLRYMTINEYITAMNTIRAACATPIVEDTCAKNYLQVISMEVGILSRSTGTIGSEANLNTQTTFDVAGTNNVTLSGDAAVNKRYLRQAVNQVVAIRNTLGAS